MKRVTITRGNPAKEDWLQIAEMISEGYREGIRQPEGINWMLEDVDGEDIPNKEEVQQLKIAVAEQKQGYAFGASEEAKDKTRLEIIDGVLRDNIDLRKMLYDLYQDDIIEYVLASREYIHIDQAVEYAEEHPRDRYP